MKSTQRLFAPQVMICFGIVMLLSLNAEVAKAQWTTTSNGDATNNNSSGKVGIGTTAPTEPLQVNNAVRISPYSPNTSGSYLNAAAVLRLLNGNIYQSGGSEVSGIQFGGMYNPSGTQTDAFYNYIDWSGGWLRIRNNQQTKIQIGAGDEWGRQDIYFNPSGGKVGIGTTNPQAKLQINYGSSNVQQTAFGLGGIPNIFLGSNTGFTSGSGQAYFGLTTGLAPGVPLGGTGSYHWGIVTSSDPGTQRLFHFGYFPDDDISQNFVSNAWINGRNGNAYYAGNVGIGTTSPSVPFHLHANIGSNTGVTFEHTNGTQGITIGYTGIAKATTNGNNNLYIDAASNGSVVFNAISGSGSVGIGTLPGDYKLNVNGNANVTGNINLTGSINAKYQDVAEWVPSSEQLSAGTVVILDSTKSNQVTASSVSYDTRVAGVVSEQPGIALGEKSDGKVLVATTGRVRVKVDATRSPIRVGDLLVTSDVLGVAMKSEPINLGGVQLHRPGTLIGKALEPLEKGKGEILVLLSLQ
jgi:hypothetical protein